MKKCKDNISLPRISPHHHAIDNHTKSWLRQRYIHVNIINISHSHVCPMITFFILIWKHCTYNAQMYAYETDHIKPSTLTAATYNITLFLEDFLLKNNEKRCNNEGNCRNTMSALCNFLNDKCFQTELLLRPYIESNFRTINWLNSFTKYEFCMQWCLVKLLMLVFLDTPLSV